MLTIYSIVNTLVLNMEEIRWVKLLIGGQEAATLAGHVDLSHLFNADMLWVRPRKPGWVGADYVPEHFRGR